MRGTHNLINGCNIAFFRMLYVRFNSIILKVKPRNMIIIDLIVIFGLELWASFYYMSQIHDHLITYHLCQGNYHIYQNDSEHIISLGKYRN